MSSTPQYASTPVVGMNVLSVANTARDGSGTVAVILSAGVSGTRIDQIEIQATGTTTAGMVRLFVSDGTNHRLFAEIPVIAVTPSATQPAWSTLVAGNSQGLVNGLPLPFAIPTGYSLRASTHNAENFNVIAFGGNF